MAPGTVAQLAPCRSHPRRTTAQAHGSVLCNSKVPAEPSTVQDAKGRAIRPCYLHVRTDARFQLLSAIATDQTWCTMVRNSHAELSKPSPQAHIEMWKVQVRALGGRQRAASSSMLTEYKFPGTASILGLNRTVHGGGALYIIDKGCVPVPLAGIATRFGRASVTSEQDQAGALAHLSHVIFVCFAVPSHLGDRLPWRDTPLESRRRRQLEATGDRAGGQARGFLQPRVIVSSLAHGDSASATPTER